MPVSVTLKTAPPIKSKPVEISVSYPDLSTIGLLLNTACDGSTGEVQKFDLRPSSNWRQPQSWC